MGCRQETTSAGELVGEKMSRLSETDVTRKDGEASAVVTNLT